MQSKIFEVLAYCVPSVITAGLAYYFFKAYFADQQNTRKWLVQRENQKTALPLRLQAYERMTLFLERIGLTKLLVRVAPISENKHDYETLLIGMIEQEFEHNLTQQIYVSEECWTIILTAKNATIQMIRKIAMSEKTTSPDKLREIILNELLDKQSPSAAAIEYIKKEVIEIL